jgi:hypothetical protein
MAEELSGQAGQLTETMSFFKLGDNATTVAKAPKHELHIAHAGAGAAAVKATPNAAKTVPVDKPNRTTAIALAKRESATDGDFEEF